MCTLIVFASLPYTDEPIRVRIISWIGVLVVVGIYFFGEGQKTKLGHYPEIRWLDVAQGRT